jgi:2-dehydropantoate 2-reductase
VYHPDTSNVLYNDRMKVVVVGTGAVGGILGASLLRAGWDVTFIARGLNLQVLRSQGLVVEWPGETWAFDRLRVLNEADLPERFDVALFCVKGYDYQTSLPILRRFSSDRILTFQNGVMIHKQLRSQIHSKVAGCVIYVAAERVEAGRIVSRSPARVVLDGSPDMTLIAISLRDALNNPNLTAVVSENIELDLWRKYLFLCAFSAINTLAEKPLGAILQEPATKQLFEKALREIVHVGNAEGVQLADSDVTTTMENAAKFPTSTSSSLFADYRKGKQTEIDLLQGYLIQLADKHKLDLPVSRTIYSLLKLKTAV